MGQGNSTQQQDVHNNNDNDSDCERDNVNKIDEVEEKRLEELDKEREERLRMEILTSLWGNLFAYKELSKNGSKHLAQLYDEKDILSEKLENFLWSALPATEFNISGESNVKFEEAKNTLKNFSDFSISARKERVQFQENEKAKIEDEIKWRNNFAIIGFPTASQLKKQIHLILLLFHRTEILSSTKKLFVNYPDRMIVKLFEELFPEITKFFRQLIHFEDIKISTDPDGHFREVDQSEDIDPIDYNDLDTIEQEFEVDQLDYRVLKIEIPIDNLKIQKNFPKLYSPFSGLINLKIKLYHVLPSSPPLLFANLSLSHLSFFADFIVSDGKFAYMDEELNVIKNDEQKVERMDVDLDGDFDLMIVINPSLLLFSWTSPIPFPEIQVSLHYSSHNNDNHNGNNNNDHNENINGENEEKKFNVSKLRVSVTKIEQTNTEWVLSFLLPIEKWKKKIMENCAIEYTSTPFLMEDSNFFSSYLKLSVQAQVPTIPPTFANLFKIFAHQTLLAEFLSLSSLASKSIYFDFRSILRKYSNVFNKGENMEINDDEQ